MHRISSTFFHRAAYQLAFQGMLLEPRCLINQSIIASCSPCRFAEGVRRARYSIRAFHDTAAQRGNSPQPSPATNAGGESPWVASTTCMFLISTVKHSNEFEDLSWRRVYSSEIWTTSGFRIRVIGCSTDHRSE